MKYTFSKRQEDILSLLQSLGAMAVRDIVVRLGDVSRVTVSRDMAFLLKKGLIQQQGAGRSVVYFLTARSKIFQPFPPDAYFSHSDSDRGGNRTFDFGIFDAIWNPFDTSEKKLLDAFTRIYGDNISRLPATIHKQEFERLVIEFSWKSSQIEGNTYSLLETEALITRHQEAKGHPREEAVMILNHKAALEYIRKHVKSFCVLSFGIIIEIHTLLTQGLGIEKGLRKSPVGITGTLYRPLDNEFQIREAVEKMCAVVNAEQSPYGKALLVNILIAYIQPFMDGNKRTSRMMGNALLLAYDCCPLSYRSADETEYKKAVVLFYEQNSLVYFKKLFLEQARFAVEHYFRAQ